MGLDATRNMKLALYWHEKYNVLESTLGYYQMS